MAQVMVVDDDEDLREAVAACLEAEGHTVKLARNGQEGLREIEAAWPPVDLVITDLHMPVCDGVTFLKQLREIPGRASLPCVMFSADPSLASLTFVRTLSKPFSIDCLMREVDAALQKTPLTVVN